MAHNPFNPDGTWNWQNVGVSEHDEAIKAAEEAWRKAGKKTEEPWNHWQIQKSPEELEAFNKWKQAYVNFNDMTTKPGENWFRQEWDSNEVHAWAEEQLDEYSSKMDYEERLAFRTFCEATDYEYRVQEWNAWCLYGRAEWWANKSRPDAWKELLKQAERNRQQQKQERTWKHSFRFSFEDSDESFRDWWRDTYGSQGRSKNKLTKELARALILSNLDKFDVHYAEYWQRQRRMQMNEAKSKIGQLSIVHVPTVQERFMSQCRQTGATEQEAAMLAETVWPPLSEKSEVYDNFVSRVMSPLFKWNQ